MNALENLEHLLKLTNEQLKNKGYSREEVLKSYGIVKYYMENLTCRQAFMLHYLQNSEPGDETKFYKIIKTNYFLVKYLYLLDKHVDVHAFISDLNLEKF